MKNNTGTGTRDAVEGKDGYLWDSHIGLKSLAKSECIRRHWNEN